MLLSGSKLIIIIRLINIFSQQNADIYCTTPLMFAILFSCIEVETCSSDRVRWHQPRNSDLYDSGWSNFELTGPLAFLKVESGNHDAKTRRFAVPEGRWFQKFQRGQSWQQYSRVKIGGLAPPKMWTIDE